MLSSRREGFSLIELMIALGVLGVVVVYLLSTLTYQQQTYVVLDQVAETHQNTRAMASLLERDVRNAGYLVPAAAAACGVDRGDAPDTVYLSDTDAIRPVDELPSSLAAKELGARVESMVTGSPTVLTVDSAVIDEVASYDLDADGTNDSDFRVGAGAILVDVANPSRGTACGRVTAVTLGGSDVVSIAFDNGLGSTAPLPADLRLVPAHVYQVQGTGPPELRRDGDLLAKDVEDLQVAWFFDDDGDGQADPGEYRGVSGTSFDPSTLDGNELRELRVTLVARTRGEDPRNPQAAGTGQATENRGTNVAGDDGRRRRLHTATLRLRNVPL